MMNYKVTHGAQCRARLSGPLCDCAIDAVNELSAAVYEAEQAVQALQSKCLHYQILVEKLAANNPRREKRYRRQIARLKFEPRNLVKEEEVMARMEA